MVAVIAKFMMTGGVSDHQATESTVADQDIGTETENEVRYVEVARREHGIRKRVGGSCLEEQVGRTTDAECGVWPDWLITTHAAGVEP